MSRGNPYGKDSFPAHEVERRMMLALTHGAGPSIAVAQPEHLKPAIRHSLAEVKKRKPWLTHKSPEPWAAILVSDNTRVFYGRSGGQVEERYLANVFGFFRAALEEHLPFTLINDWNMDPDHLADLLHYKVLVLPNAACLNDRQAEAVRRFSERGGGVVASLDTGLCDEFGTLRAKPALGDVLGVEHRGVAAAGQLDEKLDENFARTLPPDYWQKRKGVWDFHRNGPAASFLQGERLQALVGKGAVTFKGPVARVEPRPGGVVEATVRPKDSGKGDVLPAVVSRTEGAGKIVYLAAGIDAAYYLSSYPYHRLVLAGAMRWAAAAPPPVEVTAPLCVHAVTMRQKKNGQRLIVHLFNDVNTAAGHGHPAEEVPLREETLPIHDIAVRFRGYAIERVHLEPGCTELKPVRDGDVVRITVPRLVIHAMVVAELR
jgi:hypothetical protein